MLSDDELVEQILLGNENAAEELIKRYYTSILRYCRWHCSNLEKAEDLTQETFLKLFKNLSGYKGKKKFKAYLYTIANHLCIDESRKVEFSPLEDEEDIVHEYNDIVRLEDRAEISYFLNFLSSEQREAVILRFGEQLSFGEIILQGTVPELIHKANGKVWELSVSPQEARQWQTKTTVANLRHEGKEIILRIISDNMPSERAVPCEATLEDLYLFYFPTEEGVK